ncbi:alanine--tRNA ligase, mitochondrial [Corythoichthys intestinalis]|uniref:alanine--tRNA ligase, mitochondrial n=1 Tax=Corythoichthys intestinalis TaxID=161448 RepID=UPI0025A67D57|nr:alanine--tRNA ligase, mitochondrial [Corythoichthys intestinalis]XP_061792122.1 alanine--tRNA ligase, mitochondrial-like [Nerophis lumbriciformis]
MLTHVRRSLGSARLAAVAAGASPPLRRRCSACPPEVSAARVRKTFVDFFEGEHGHLRVPSSPVRPRGDPSLLFVNAGMNQFKPILLGTADPRGAMASYRRVVNSQKCVRAGGKHNDLDDVGKDVYHHTFFEMLGNWSFGDYFKEEACATAWTLLTERYGIAPDRLYVSYFAGDVASGMPADEETRHIWLDLGVPPDRLLPFGMKENFWEMGDTGPCGPCTEIHYDRVGGRNAAALVNAGHPDVLEIWNLVFMQYSRESDGELRFLPARSVDTGMGLERLVSVLQGKSSNYDTDLFTPLMEAIRLKSGAPAYGGRTGPGERLDTAYRVVADHARALAVCIADGVHPGMSGAELVLRKILRRAVRFCAEVLRAPPGTLASLVPHVACSLGDVYPELRHEAERAMDIINENEEQFLSSLRRGRGLIRRTLRTLDPQHQTLFPARVACSLHRDLGFPLDLIQLVLDEEGAAVDRDEVERLLADERNRAAAEQPGDDADLTVGALALDRLRQMGVAHTDDAPKYEYRLRGRRYEFQVCRARVLAMLDGEVSVSQAEPGRRCAVVLDRTSFYAEQGGQDADRGYFVRDDLQEVPFSVEAVSKAGGYVFHWVTAADALRTGDVVHLHLDQAHRVACMRNHTATHLLNFALRDVLGPSVQQRGSHVSARRLRFDFSVKGSPSAAQLQQAEAVVSEAAAADGAVSVRELPLEDALAIEGVRTVDEAYPDPVRVVSAELSDGARRTSVELCCGTHLARTAAIGDLVIVSERQLVKGISRVVAVTGTDAEQAREAGRSLVDQVESLEARLAGSASSCLDSARRLAKEVGIVSDVADNTPVPQWQRTEARARLKALQRRSNTAVRKLEAKQAALDAQLVLGANGQEDVLVDVVDTASLAVLMKTVNAVSSARPSAHVMLLALQKSSGKILCACQVPKDSPAFPASRWAEAVCRWLGGEGGGSATVARGMGRAGAGDTVGALRWAEAFARRFLSSFPERTESAAAGPER